MELFVFVCAAIMILVGALGVVLRSNPVHAALSMILTLFGVAVLFVSRDANFLAAVQVIVYAGAIVVLFLFVIMLLGVDKAEDLSTEPLGNIQRPLAVVLGGGIAAILITAIVKARDTLKFTGDGKAWSGPFRVLGKAKDLPDTAALVPARMGVALETVWLTAPGK